MNLVYIGGLVLVGLLGLTGATEVVKNKIEKVQLVSPIVSITPTIIATPSATPAAELASPSATSTPKPRIKVTPKPTPTIEPPEKVNKLVDKYSIEYGLDPNVVRHLGLCESGFRSNATNGKYVGLFQYDTQTWSRIRTEMGLSTDPDLRYSAEEMIKTTSYALAKGKTKLWPHCVP